MYVFSMSQDRFFCSFFLYTIKWRSAVLLHNIHFRTLRKSPSHMEVSFRRNLARRWSHITSRLFKIPYPFIKKSKFTKKPTFPIVPLLNERKTPIKNNIVFLKRRRRLDKRKIPTHTIQVLTKTTYSAVFLSLTLYLL